MENKSYHEKFLDLAHKEALKAYKKKEVPIGAIVVKDGVVIAKAHNNRERSQKFYGHAEFLALKKASKKLKSWRLDGCDLYVTLEPCAMCAGAIIQSRIKNVYFTTFDLKTGASGSIIDLFKFKLGYKVNVVKLDDLNRSENLIKDFFKKLRRKE